MQSQKPLLLSNGSCLLRGKREVFTWEHCTASDLNRKKTNAEQAGTMNQASFHQTWILQWALLSPYYRCENTESETLSNLFKVSTRSTEEIWNPGPLDSKTAFLTALSIRSLSLLEFIEVPLVQDVSPLRFLTIFTVTLSFSLWIDFPGLSWEIWKKTFF